MINYLSEYEYLGNSLYKFNANMHELNIRFDNLYSESVKWNSFFTTMERLSANLESFITTVPQVSSTWKTSANLVYNLQGFWEEPIMIVFKDTFNMVGNFFEIKNWLTNNFPCSNFPVNQLIRCDFLCKNYNPNKFQQYIFEKENTTVVESLAKTYQVRISDVYKYLSYLNQLESIKNALNSLYIKNDLRTNIIQDWEDIRTLTSHVSYDFINHKFKSTELPSFSHVDLEYFYSYIKQFVDIDSKMALLIDKGISDLPDNVLVQFKNKNVEVYTGNSFFFKNINSEWMLYPYNGSEFCAANNCGDCYDLLNIHELYDYSKDCIDSFEYVLTECYE